MPPPERIRSILVALDGSPQSLAALEAATELAASLGAKLIGVFVEDINLVRLGGLPPVREVGQASGHSRRLDERRIGYELRGQATRVRQALEDAAQRMHVSWSFRVSRGSIEVELLEAATSADLIILGKAGWSGKRQLGSTAEAIISAAPARTLVLEAKDRLVPTLMAVYDGSEMSRRALDTAVDLAQQRHGYLAVAIVAGDAEAARGLQKEASDLLRDSELETRFRWLVKVDSSTLGEMISTQEECILVLPGESPLLEGKSLGEALKDFDCPVLLVR